jgi:leucyl aminopeptidase
MYTNQSESAVPIIPVQKDQLKTFLEQQSDSWAIWVKSTGFIAKSGEICLMPDAEGEIACILVGVETEDNKTWVLGSLPDKLPKGHYQLVIDPVATSEAWTDDDQIKAIIGWGLGSYTFDVYKHQQPSSDSDVVLYLPEGFQERVTSFTNAIFLTRDLINTPANHMMPEQLSFVTARLAREFGAEFTEITGDLLLEENYPMIHAVGRASEHPPRLLELIWGDEKYPRVTLVGKGVCFDTGGLDLKPSKFMRQMKKDMGGAAHVLGLASLIMQNNLPVHLRVLIPAVENAVSGNAFRPGDVITARSGKSVEIDNTDAEGRLVLCDALADAVGDDPDLLIDFATLTGAARVALGTEVPVYFANDESIVSGLNESCEETQELVWQLPLHNDYKYQLKSDCADILNCSPEGYGGAITAALFLQEFVPESVRWAHFDVMAWNNRSRSGRPKGGEAMGLFSVYAWLEQQYAAQ